MMNLLIAASRLRLQPGEAIVDPTLRGIAHVTKQIGDRTYEAWVDSRHVKDDGASLECFPDHHVLTHTTARNPQGPRLLPDLPTPEFVSININEWTTWQIPTPDFDALEFVEESPTIQFHSGSPDDGKYRNILQKVLDNRAIVDPDIIKTLAEFLEDTASEAADGPPD